MRTLDVVGAAGGLDVITAHERGKYEEMWAVSDYAKVSPGEDWADTFLELCAPDRLPGMNRILDAGCGTGRVAHRFERAGFHVTLLDLTDAGLPSERGTAMGRSFVQRTLWKPLGDLMPFDFGYCCDVLEHLPIEYTMLSVVNLLQRCRYLFLTVALRPDSFGLKIGQPLHLTVQPFQWWRDHFREIATVRDARDCLQSGVFYLTWD